MRRRVRRGGTVLIGARSRGRSSNRRCHVSCGVPIQDDWAEAGPFSEVAQGRCARAVVEEGLGVITTRGLRNAGSPAATEAKNFPRALFSLPKSLFLHWQGPFSLPFSPCQGGFREGLCTSSQAGLCLVSTCLLRAWKVIGRRG